MSLFLLSMIYAAGTAHTNLTAETILNGGTYTIPANALAKGKQIRLRGCVKVTAAQSTDTLNVKLSGNTSAAAGGTSIGATGAIDVTTNDVLVFDVVLQPRSARGSTAGTVVCHGHISALGAEGTGTPRAVYEVLTVDYTAAYYLMLTGTWSVASASNSCQVEAFDVSEAA